MVAKSTFLTNHALVLIYIGRNPRATLRRIAQGTNLTERTVYKIVGDLARNGYIVKGKEGRRNAYSVNEEIAWSASGGFGSLTVPHLVAALGALAGALERRR